MAIDVNEISAIIKKQIKDYAQSVKTSEEGQILTVGDGIAYVSGLDNAKLGELLDFGHDIYGLILNLEEDAIGVVIFGDANNLIEGQKVKRTNKLVSVGVGNELIGRVVNAIGEPVDGLGAIEYKQTKEIFKVAPGVMTRESVSEPLETGIIAIDSMIPIGRGQRELIIGDRQTGKTSIAIDTILNQKGKDVHCVYVAIGQKNSSVVKLVENLKNFGAMEYTTVVVAGAAELAPMQYIAPFTGVTIAEEWMAQGKDVLIVYDDLSKHAVAYRTLSLILRRPPGREAYPGDIFYLHSQLLERAARLNENYGGGSITALPIIETQSGDISAYIPTNVISITDGQIFTKESLFNSGQRPAIDVGFSVSRVGSAAQKKAIKSVSSSLKLELAQYNEMQAFSKFGSDLDDNTLRVLKHGEKIYKILIQEQYKPYKQMQQALILLTVKERLINKVALENILEYKNQLVLFAKSNEEIQSLKERIYSEKIEGDLKEKLVQLLNKFTKQFNQKNTSPTQAVPR